MNQNDIRPSSQVHPDSALPSRPTQPRWIPDAECKQRRCARPTTGCWDKCGLDEVLGHRNENCVVATVSVSASQFTQPSDFKNFHRLLCERFGYAHDEQDWHRDQLSLIEHITARVGLDIEEAQRALHWFELARRHVFVQPEDEALVAKLLSLPVPPGATWTPASAPPDADITVMLALAEGEVWQGYYDGAMWIEVSGLQLADGRVKYWKHTPSHPEDKQ